jgi:hypothetical protein
VSPVITADPAASARRDDPANGDTRTPGDAHGAIRARDIVNAKMRNGVIPHGEMPPA